ncbi:MAG: hypothetical protein R2741_11875 [Methanolobus sp.]
MKKHKKLIDEYSTEFNELGSKIQQIQENIDSSRKNREEMKEKMDILAERQLFYHQAEKTLKGN